MKINRNQLKYILIIAMLIDHITWAFIPTRSIAGQCLHFIGRLTGPGMALLLAQGYQYTRNKCKYALRLFIFAMISWIPYSLNDYGVWPYIGLGMFGMIWTLFIAFLTVWMWDQLNTYKAVKVILVIVACFLSLFGDWSIFAVLWALFAYIYRDEPRKKWISFSIVAVCEVLLAMLFAQNPLAAFFQTGVVMVPFLFAFCYNGKPGSKAAFHKWFFYVFYPLHLMIIYLIKTAVL